MKSIYDLTLQELHEIVKQYKTKEAITKELDVSILVYETVLAGYRYFLNGTPTTLKHIDFKNMKVEQAASLFKEKYTQIIQLKKPNLQLMTLRSLHAFIKLYDTSVTAALILGTDSENLRSVFTLYQFKNDKGLQEELSFDTLKGWSVEMAETKLGSNYDALLKKRESSVNPHAFHQPQPSVSGNKSSAANNAEQNGNRKKHKKEDEAWVNSVLGSK